MEKQIIFRKSNSIEELYQATEYKIIIFEIMISHLWCNLAKHKNTATFYFKSFHDLLTFDHISSHSEMSSTLTLPKKSLELRPQGVKSFVRKLDQIVISKYQFPILHNKTHLHNNYDDANLKRYNLFYRCTFIMNYLSIRYK